LPAEGKGRFKERAFFWRASCWGLGLAAKGTGRLGNRMAPRSVSSETDWRMSEPPVWGGRKKTIQKNLKLGIFQRSQFGNLNLATRARLLNSRGLGARWGPVDETGPKAKNLIPFSRFEHDFSARYFEVEARGIETRRGRLPSQASWTTQDFQLVSSLSGNRKMPSCGYLSWPRGDLEIRELLGRRRRVDGGTVTFAEAFIRSSTAFWR